jgi:hypothetical protein
VDDDLLSIGRFAGLCRLSIGALRHYDELDIPRPALVSETTTATVPGHDASRWRDLAREALAAIEDPADRELIEGDLATLPL